MIDPASASRTNTRATTVTKECAFRDGSYVDSRRTRQHIYHSCPVFIYLNSLPRMSRELLQALAVVVLFFSLIATCVSLFDPFPPSIRKCRVCFGCSCTKTAKVAPIPYALETALPTAVVAINARVVRATICEERS